MADPVTALRFTPELKAAIEMAAKRAGLSSSAWIRRAVERELNWATPSTPSPSRRPARPSQANCYHPSNARLGKGCGLCGKDPV